MARKIIVLEQQGLPSDVSYRVAFWLDVPAARQVFYANAEAVSQVKNATAAELTAIQNGAVVEQVGAFVRLIGTGLAAIQAQLVTAYNQAQTELNTNNPWNRYGTTWDGTSWQNVTVP